MSAVVVAHAGHWLVNLLYALPVVVIGGGLAWAAWKERGMDPEDLDAPDDDDAAFAP